MRTLTTRALGAAIVLALVLAGTAFADTVVTELNSSQSNTTVSIEVGQSVPVKYWVNATDPRNRNDAEPVGCNVSTSTPAVVTLPNHDGLSVSPVSRQLSITGCGPENGVTFTITGVTARDTAYPFTGGVTVTGPVSSNVSNFHVTVTEPAAAANAAPVISSFSLGRTDACTVSASVAWTDADADDVHRVLFDWGYTDEAGAPVATLVDPATSATSQSHTFPAAGTFTVTATVSDGTESDDESASFATQNRTGGLLEPIKPGGASTFKVNSSIPVKLVVTDCGGDLVTDISPTVSLRKIDTSVDPATTVESVDNVVPTNGKQMVWNGELYLYVLSTKNSQFNNSKALDQGTYEVAVSHSSFDTAARARFDLKK